MRDGVRECLQFVISILQFVVQFLNDFQLFSLVAVVGCQIRRLRFDDLRLAGQLDKHTHLGFENLRHDRKKHIIHRAEFVTFEAVQIGGVIAGNEYNRGFLETRPLPNESRRFEAVHVRHVHVQQNDSEVVAKKWRALRCRCAP